MLVLDATGRITAANASARALWQTAAGELVGEAFAGLFAFEIVSSDPEFLEVQWEGIVITALDQEVTLSAQPREGAPRDVRVRLEKTLGPTLGYIATVQSPRAATAAPGAGDDRATAFQLLADQGAAGFFDLNLSAGKVRFSPAWKKILGFADAELPNSLESWHQLIHLSLIHI